VADLCLVGMVPAAGLATSCHIVAGSKIRFDGQVASSLLRNCQGQLVSNRAPRVSPRGASQVRPTIRPLPPATQEPDTAAVEPQRADTQKAVACRMMSDHVRDTTANHLRRAGAR
jgi:hypothetical protein